MKRKRARRHTWTPIVGQIIGATPTMAAIMQAKRPGLKLERVDMTQYRVVAV